MLVRFKNNFSPVERNFDRVMKNFFTDDLDGFFLKPSANKFTPAVNVVEAKDNFRLEIAVPGFTKDDFNVKLEDHLLTISGEKKNQVNNEDEKFTLKEFTHTSFSRTFTLPETVSGEKINAEYADGILKLLIPKKEEVKAKQVEIKVS